MQFDVRRLFVISYLQVAKDTLQPQNTFEAFFPFIVAAAEPKSGSRFDPHAIAVKLRTTLGWPATRDFVELFIDDLAKRRLIEADGANYRWTTSAEAPDEAEIRERIEHLKSAFFEFSNKLSSLLMAAMSPDDRLHQLAISMLTNKLFTMAALESYILQEDATEQLELQQAQLTTENFDYVCARFIKHCKKNDKKSFESLIVLANLGVVTQLAQFFHKRADGVEKTGSPLIILDGPFLLDLMGFAGNERQHDAQIIVALAKNRACRIATFRHSIVEAFDIVRAVVTNSPIRRFGHVAHALRTHEISQQTLSIFMSDTIGFVKRLGVVDEIIEFKDRRITTNAEYFSANESAGMMGRLTGWYNALAQQRDADSITYVMRMRGGHADKSHWRSKVLFLTSNEALSRIARQFVVDEEMIDEDQAGPAITRQEFAAILWLAGDPKNKAEIASAQLLSAAQSVLARDRRFIERVREFAGGVSSDKKEFIEAIVQQEISYEMLRDVTLADPTRVNQKAFDTVIEGLVDKGREQGRAEAKVDSSLAVKRARADAERSKIDAERSKLENEKLLASQEKTRQEIADRLNKHGQAMNVIGGFLDDAEERWSRPIPALQVGVTIIGFALLGVIAFIASVSAYKLNEFAGIGLLLVVALVGAGIIATEHLKKNLAKHVETIAIRCALKLAEADIELVRKRLPVPPSRLDILNESGRLRIQNRAEILEAVSLRESEEGISALQPNHGQLL